MSEVKRYDMCGFGGGLVERPEGAWYHMDDFDRVTAERDALQALLTAAYERADVLVDLLTHAHIAIHAMEPGFFLLEKIDAVLKPAEGGGDDWQSWAVGNTVRYQGSGQDGEDCYCRMRKGSDYLIHEAPDDHESMVVLDDDGDELCVLVGEFKWIKP